MTPTARTLALLRREGFLPAVVERWNPRVNVRSDLWHFGDVLAVHPRDRIFLIVQVTTAGNMSSRLKKARARPELALWLRAGGRFEVHGWTQRNGSWHCRRIAVQAEDLAPIIIAQPPRKRRRSRFTQGELFSGFE